MAAQSAPPYCVATLPLPQPTIVFAGGELRCAGNGVAGQLGDGTSIARPTASYVSGLGAGTSVAKVAAGQQLTRALVGTSCTTGTTCGVKCWGYNGGWMLGDGTNIDRHSPTAVGRLSSGVRDVVLGQFHACALLSPLEECQAVARGRRNHLYKRMGARLRWKLRRARRSIDGVVLRPKWEGMNQDTGLRIQNAAGKQQPHRPAMDVAQRS